jgi:hypothetical protein
MISTDSKRRFAMGLLGTIFNYEALKTIADMPSQGHDYVGEGLINKMANIGGTGPTGPGGMA